MKYYEMHEVVYRRLKEEEVLSWDKSKTFEQMWSHSTNTFLKKLLANVQGSLNGLDLLDLGTGTGTSALFAAKEGAKSVGVEISSSALAIAHKNAAKLAIDAEFILGDVLELDLNRKFDLVVDSTILHCIVGTDDRSRFYKTAKKHLKADGYLFVNTMIVSDNMVSRFPREYFLFQDDVLWSLGISEITARKIIEGKSYFPHRTILSKEKQIEEFHANRFEVVELEEVRQKDGYDLVALLKMI
jgi:cyclopropane fatty-acyl-phospholipid synthase-like methyltransferase